jgi:uncharacterized membrane protein YqjE
MSTEPDLSTQPKRPEASLGELFSEMTSEIGTLFRQEVELARTETRQEVSRASRAAAMLAVAGVAALLTVSFLSAALAWLLDDVMHVALAFAIVGVLWMIVAAVLASVGRKRIAEMKTLPETTRSIKEDVQWLKEQRS